MSGEIGDRSVLIEQLESIVSDDTCSEYEAIEALVHTLDALLLHAQKVSYEFNDHDFIVLFQH